MKTDNANRILIISGSDIRKHLPRKINISFDELKHALTSSGIAIGDKKVQLINANGDNIVSILTFINDELRDQIYYQLNEL